MKKVSNKKKMVRKTYNLPNELADWLSKQAKKDGRSASNYLAKILADKWLGVK